MANAFQIDTDAIAEGICNSAPGSTIELFIDLIDVVLDDMIPDAVWAIGYMPERSGEECNEATEKYTHVKSVLYNIREAIQERENEEEGD